MMMMLTPYMGEVLALLTEHLREHGPPVTHVEVLGRRYRDKTGSLEEPLGIKRIFLREAFK